MNPLSNHLLAVGTLEADTTVGIVKVFVHGCGGSNERDVEEMDEV